MIDESRPRPALSAALSEQEFRRWYWLKEELQRFARSLGVSASGSKDVLSARIAAHLSDRAAAR
ncbi:SAP domain-containing protein [Paramicrobacterium agarici]|uniref:SAP domain-containing protein n=1 Tax=Paramicrobacterium agarici TaxID=630514 RepID=UPI00114F3420|nr:SAP domain-containing protein [Microbacterium agarici]